MGTHMQCQAVPLISPESPIIGTGMEGLISQMMGRVIYAPYDAEVNYADANKIIIKGKGRKKKQLIKSILSKELLRHSLHTKNNG